MLQQLLITTVAVPLILGLIIAFAEKMIPARSGILTALLFLIGAIIVHIVLEGAPAYPPVASKAKIVYLIGGYIVLLLAFLATRKSLSTVAAFILTAIVVSVPMYWLGKNIFAANSEKTLTVVIVLAIGLVSLPLAARKQTANATGVPGPFPAALFAMFIASALTALLGAFIGMGQINGALAAMTGGWLLVRYIAFIRGNDAALSVSPLGALAIGWIAILHLASTALFAPGAAPAAVILSIVPIAAVLIADRIPGVERMSRALRPLVIGVVTGIPAVVAIIVAAILSTG